jgi:hypothetical protein
LGSGDCACDGAPEALKEGGEGGQHRGGGSGCGVGEGEQGGGFEDALGLGVVGVFGDAVVGGGAAFVLFTANRGNLTVFEHLFSDSRRIYLIVSYLIYSIIIQNTLQTFIPVFFIFFF